MATDPSENGHARRAAWFDTLELEKRLRQAKADGRAARADVEAELRREHWGRLPENWNGGGRRRDEV
jgi:hypothetical protein